MDESEGKYSTICIYISRFPVICEFIIKTSPVFGEEMKFVSVIFFKIFGSERKISTGESFIIKS